MAELEFQATQGSEHLHKTLRLRGRIDRCFFFFGLVGAEGVQEQVVDIAEGVG
jgi:hypothetical protein